MYIYIYILIRGGKPHQMLQLTAMWTHETITVQANCDW